MIRQIVKAWSENSGNLLVVLGSVAGLLMCLTWYFQLLPEVSLMARGIPGTLVSASPRPNSSSLVAIVRTPTHDSASPIAMVNADTGETLRAIVEVYSPHDSLLQENPPLLAQSVALRADGAPVAVVFHDLPPGKYAAVAYIDVNGSGSFDMYESASEGTTEPFCLARSLAPARSAGAETEASGGAIGEELNSDESPPGESAATDDLLPPGIIEVAAAQATLIVLEFTKPE